MKFTLNNINKPYYYIMMCTINFVNFFHLFFYFFTVKWKWFQRRQFSMWPKTKRLWEYNGQKILWPFAIVDMCAQVLISWFLLRPESLQFVIKNTYYSSLFIFVSKGIHLLYLLPSKCLTFFTIWQFNAF